MASTEFKSAAVMEQVQMLDALLLLSDSVNLRLIELQKDHGRTKLSGGNKEPRILDADYEGFWTAQVYVFSASASAYKADVGDRGSGDREGTS